MDQALARVLELVDAYRVCLHSRIASRVLVRLVEFRANTPQRLYEGLREVPLSPYSAKYARSESLPDERDRLR